ncbi:[protein-PII] uridylyltransferase [Bathymodiolus platifrons methanotrophic gill symbiont]|uniref:[protein-PII] uridylyltransferase n=1 Tax=Bathymodiolus platifrons methanotrophic gill symbiont TaxID=113268 RepID=UPI000B4210C7|nr:[protein-PII] uridylyltransferase [Bathymodiolus platifrons methanotrophic gill symbiont]MCK5870826.1 [protein-PII] uridylyltransferase [Methyloprofundus sp.]TXK95062.1 [protein-PII] uridylyltransferase [Methylococcaceae bacterium CS4]TXK96110.1 [protein-PII] uridylyltransferase [Methylococcaceae bacterium CS5]TXL06111.1 [protein-PII] uridylyltransferase [Methylococcaceae bacterium CS3]TXL08261.1 [protein-PII] uridylyltransferase [Methylococcaceae bacterium CS1]TXL10034.1 [protein-PII] uri
MSNISTPAQSVAKQIKQAIKQHNSYLKDTFSPKKPIQDFLLAKSQFIDKLLNLLWHRYITHNTELFALIAVGGYGRQEMFPHSDIDILVLFDDTTSEQDKQQLSEFCTILWDTGLKLGLSVRSSSECLQATIDDQTILTNLLESRHLTGNQALYTDLKTKSSNSPAWSSEDFYNAKIEEQAKRYKKFHNTAYNLEPNIKEGPGGLRDLQILAWVFKHHYQLTSLKELAKDNFLPPAEYDELFSAQELLWKIRFALHLQTGRCEDRLLFDFQRDLATLFGFDEHQNNEGVEQFMQHYFKTVMRLERLNETLLQLFNEHCLPHDGKAYQAQVINEKFDSIAGYIAARSATVFQTHPHALLEVFLLLQKIPALKGIRATTIRLIRSNLHLIDDNFRQDPIARQLFITILRQPRGITHVLRRMNRYGVLAAYLPSFNNIVARMQYDLFHIYTVDEHTLFVIRNLRRFSLIKHNKELPFCNDIFLLIQKPHILYIAGLFHDIAKGKKGDHSVLGEVIAHQFCVDHKISEHDTKLISWLVKNHLEMSTTAQRKDISDPDVIHEFAEKVGKTENLNYLYLLTVADIRATNPKLWTSWKDSLLKELYIATLNALRRGLDNPVNQQDTIRATKAEARKELLKKGLSDTSIEKAWQHISPDYFLRYYPDEIIWHTIAINCCCEKDLPLILLRPQNQRGSAEVFIYAHHQQEDFIFSRTTAALDKLGLTILDARIITSDNQYALNSFQVLEQSGEPITDLRRELHICTTIKQQLQSKHAQLKQNLHLQSRQAEYFPIATKAHFRQDPQNRYNILQLITTDHPGLLSKLGQLFRAHGFNILNAKITTIGSRAEDMFFLSTQNGQLITPEQQQTFIDELKQQLAN